MIRRLLPSVLLVLALHGAPVRADDVYVWTDASGETHYTNDLASIPDKSRRGARKLDGDSQGVIEPRTTTAKADEPKSGKAAEGDPAKELRPSEAQPPPPEAIETALVAPRPDEQVSEDQWRSLFRKANERVKRAERKAQRTREALAKLPGQDITTYDVAGNVVVESRYQTLRVQMDEDEFQLEQAREQLHDLERAAAREAIPLEWRR
jgi:hypothetical protein